MRINEKTRTLTFKIVFHGPGLSGKTTNIRRLREGLPPERRGELVELATEQERTLFFDYFPARLGEVGGYRLRVHFFTVPGQSFYARTRAAVLQGADGVIFVADSSPGREAANHLALEDLKRQLRAQGRAQVPIVFQWNKRDLPDALPVHTLERALNPNGRPSCSAMALSGEGVQLCHALLMRELLGGLRSERRMEAVG
ncbi:MAG: gliding-motility protein MglA [Alphaproteobacteria bacterium]|nr:gliding-motility protein MglA [Alphaproteobacteria bacterium]